MGKTVVIVLSLVLAACGGAVREAPAPTAAPPTLAQSTPQPTTVATPYPPKAEGFSSKVLIERPRNLGASFPGFAWIAVAGADVPGITAAVSESEAFNASFENAASRPSSATAAAPWGKTRVLYTTPDLTPLPAGNYTESLRHIVVQPAGRSSAHKHSGIEAVLVLEGSVLIRSGMGGPSLLAKGAGFFIIPNTPVQLINAGTTTARTLVYSISPVGQPFSTELDESP